MSGFTPYWILAFLGSLIFSMLVLQYEFWPFWALPSPLTFHNVKNHGGSENCQGTKNKRKQRQQHKTDRKKTTKKDTGGGTKNIVRVLWWKRRRLASAQAAFVVCVFFCCFCYFFCFCCFVFVCFVSCFCCRFQVADRASASSCFLHLLLLSLLLLSMLLLLFLLLCCSCCCGSPTVEKPIFACFRLSKMFVPFFLLFVLLCCCCLVLFVLLFPVVFFTLFVVLIFCASSFLCCCFLLLCVAAFCCFCGCFLVTNRWIPLLPLLTFQNVKNKLTMMRQLWLPKMSRTFFVPQKKHFVPWEAHPLTVPAVEVRLNGQTWNVAAASSSAADAKCQPTGVRVPSSWPSCSRIQFSTNDNCRIVYVLWSTKTSPSCCLVSCVGIAVRSSDVSLLPWKMQLDDNVDRCDHGQDVIKRQHVRITGRPRDMTICSANSPMWRWKALTTTKHNAENGGWAKARCSQCIHSKCKGICDFWKKKKKDRQAAQSGASEQQSEFCLLQQTVWCSVCSCVCVFVIVSSIERRWPHEIGFDAQF